MIAEIMVTVGPFDKTIFQKAQIIIDNHGVYIPLPISDVSNMKYVDGVAHWRDGIRCLLSFRSKDISHPKTSHLVVDIKATNDTTDTEVLHYAFFNNKMDVAHVNTEDGTDEYWLVVNGYLGAKVDKAPVISCKMCAESYMDQCAPQGYKKVVMLR